MKKNIQLSNPVINNIIELKKMILPDAKLGDGEIAGRVFFQTTTANITIFATTASDE